MPAKDLVLLANNKAIAKNLRNTFPHPYTFENAKEFLDLAKQGKIGHAFGIFTEDLFIGICSISLQQDIYINNGEIGYWIGEPYWGKGYATKAVQLLTDYAFNELKLLRVFAGVFSGNPSSMKVLEKSGYRLEAIIKSSILKNGAILDEHLYSRLNTKDQRILNE